MADLKLPKGWRNWCRRNNLRPHTWRQSRAQRNRRDWWYLKGKGYVWRVNCYGMFQRGDTHAEFDRWALCDISEVTCPQSKEEFLEAVETLLAGATNA